MAVLSAAYAPGKTPGALVWKHLEVDTAGRSAIHSHADFEAKVKWSMQSGQGQR
jgi:hypothetical protein